MKPKYRIYVLGPLPSDLKERIVAIHAAAILKGKSEVSAPAANGHSGSALPSTATEGGNEKVLSHKPDDQS